MLAAWAALTITVGLTFQFSWGVFGFFVWFEGWVIVPVSMLTAAVIIVSIPLNRIGRAIDADLRGVHAEGLARNVTEEISIASSARSRDVMIHPSPIPNVGGFPTSDGTVVMVTEGAARQLRRDELEALIAAQFAGLDDWRCLVATRAELGWKLTVVLALGSFVLATPFAVFVGAFMLLAPRFVEATRDLCADVAAIRATRHPEALAAAMRHLARAAVHSHAQSLGIRRWLPINSFLVISKRYQSTRTIYTDKEIKRKWTEVDEVESELLLRADRATALASGADPRHFTGREFRRRWSALGTGKQHS